MKILKLFVKFLEWSLRSLFIIIIYLLLIGIIKNGGFINYVYYLNGREWSDAIEKFNILEPSTISNIFYNENDLLIENLNTDLSQDKNENEDNNNEVDSNKDEDVESVNVYDPDFEKSFDTSLDDFASSTGDAGFLDINE